MAHKLSANFELSASATALSPELLYASTTLRLRMTVQILIAYTDRVYANRSGMAL
ncbi:MAG: hypothetical protein JNL69_00685 [Bacteroidia bacterium]|nr:hypothetical protein [Bacteroidia bacterium]